MDTTIGVRSQVEWRRPVRNGTLVEIGNVVSINAARGTALVNFPTLYKSVNIPLKDLQNTSKRFGPVKVQESPARRSLVKLINQ